MTKQEHKIPPTCPIPTTCRWAGRCFAKQILDHELDTNTSDGNDINHPSQHDAIESLMRAAKCTDSGFISTLWRALTFLIHNPRD